MKRMTKIYVVLSVVIVLILSGFLMLLDKKNNDGFIDNAKAAENNNNEEEKLCCSDLAGNNVYSDNSIYQLESEWENQMGKEIKLSSFKGKKVVLTMFFSRCTYACPLIINDMKIIDSKLSKNEKNDVKYILFSIDPENDTPEALRNFGSAQNLDADRWTVLTSQAENIRELAALLGFKYVKEKDGSFSHSNLIFVLNEDGEITFQHEGLNKDISDVVGKLKLKS